MTWKESRKKAFRKFPGLDLLATLIITVISTVFSLYDKTAAFGVPALGCAMGAILFFSGLRTGEKMNFLYGIRVIIICVLALFLVVILQQIVL